ncbi:adenylyltransferase/cytidyltransferase family protein, partial [Weizmannia sp. CD-2023]|uniref:adenylyltransferase/cytidyltransferase family protein n=1 Tax=Weizmannia sp. CD-2023 TaxID=3037263 RepID=UPI002DBD3097
MKKVITYGTFDLLHWGHINLLKRARALGDYLIVGLSSDEFNEIKNKEGPLFC